MSHLRPPENFIKAVGYVFLAITFYVSHDLIVRQLPPGLHTLQAFFFRVIFYSIPILLISLKRRDKDIFVFHHPMKHILRAIFTLLATVLFIQSLRMLPWTEAYALSFSSPLFISCLAPLFIREKVPLYRWGVVLVGFIGVLIILQPSAQVFNVGGVIAVLGGMFYALSLVYIRDLTEKNKDTSIVISFVLVSVVLVGVTLPFVWVPISLEVYTALALMGIFAGGGQYALVKSLELAPASAIGPFNYVSIFYALILGYYTKGEVPGLHIYIGAPLLIFSGIYLIRKEQN